MNMFDVQAILTLDTSGYERGSKEAKSITSRLGSSIKTGLKTAAVAAGAAIAAVGAAAVAVGKQALSSYADYEQLVGGVETLFKDSAGVVQDYAANAYKTAGLSANEYMETVTSFSASLLQSLGGDTDKAAAYADKAVTDMSDNANKMGTDMEMIQNAYQGFAKQNYTMLDNLKLGYGGTKTEMERLIEDAEKLDSSFVASRDESGNLAMSYADIVDAIHIVQTEMGITGTTALEASTTIQGSVNAMKGAWANLLTGLADDTADIDGLIDKFIDSALTAVGNILPRIGKIMGGLVTLISEGVPKIMPIIVQLIVDNLPMIIGAGIQILIALVTGILTAIPQLVEALPQIFEAIKTAFIENAPAMKEAGIQLLTSLITGIGNALSSAYEFVSSKLSEWVSIAQAKISEFGQSIHDGFTALVTEVGTWVQENIITPLRDGISDAVNIGREVVEKIKQGISSAWGSLKSWFNGIWDSLFGNRNVNVNVSGNGYPKAIGMDYVPANGFPAILHKGEAVLTAREAEEWRRGRDGGSIINLNQYIQSVPQTPVELAAATTAYLEQARWA